MNVISSEKIPIKLWLDDLEGGALDQAKNLANLPFAFKHIAMMPDSHWGYGMPIGGVLATKNIIIPNAVGVDIGCGMCAVKTSIKVEEVNKEILKRIMGKIREVVPVGFKKHEKLQCYSLMPELEKYGKDVTIREFSNAQKSLGTLGGGNHFIEIQSDGENIWVMIHSGSRNLGKQVADYYNKEAKEINARYFSSVPKEWDLAFLPFDSTEGKAYFREMQYCVDFAFANRQLMMKRVLQIFQSEFLSIGGDIFGENKIINIAHNYAVLENHFGINVLVHRKGATRARKGEIGIIPGSQGTASYIVEGLGNEESFKSCSHGAGRVMGRKQAQRTLNLENEIKKMEDKGIIHNIRTEKDLDEASSAYKDIDKVMENQKDLVKILVKLKSLAVVKG